MFSGKHSIVPLSEIVVAPDRQRRTLKGIEELAASIQQTGLIHPIIVTPDHVLVAGERRFRAHQLLALTHIEVRYTTDLSRQELERIELEENVKRSDLSWQEECLSVLRYHEMRAAETPEWRVEDTATALSFSLAYASQRVMVARALQAGEPLVVQADSFTIARNALARVQQRANDSLGEAIDAAFDDDLGEDGEEAMPGPVLSVPTAAVLRKPEATIAASVPPAAKPALVSGPIFHADFHDFAATYSGPKFNFLHCDFPYGINVGKHNQGAAKKFGGYDDTADVYFDLLETLCEFTETGLAPSAHMMFWLAPKYLGQTRTMLTAAGWKVNDYPLIWHRSDNSGIIPDPKRTGRQVYEMALHCTLGDRFVAQSVANLFGCPQQKEVHTSSKPRAMLAHFFRMFVDSSTVMLDPTAGSGNAVNVAQKLGAKSAIGLEKDEEYVGRALKLLAETANESY